VDIQATMLENANTATTAAARNRNIAALVGISWILSKDQSK
jgi:hypothetical protein